MDSQKMSTTTTTNSGKVAFRWWRSAPTVGSIAKTSIRIEHCGTVAL